MIRFPYHRLILATLVFGFAAVAEAARDDQLIAQLKDEIHTAEAMVTEGATPAERTRLEKRLETLKQELAVFEKRQAIEAQEHTLQANRHGSPRQTLDDKLHEIPTETTAAEAHARDLDKRQAQAATERDQLQRQLSDAGLATDAVATAKAAELEERLFTKNEELRALALGQEAVEHEIDLIRRAQAVRERLRTAQGFHASLRALFERRTRRQENATASEELTARLANLDENFRNSQATVELDRQKLAKFDEEMQLLEHQTSFFRRNPRAEQLMAQERAQKQLLGERLPFLSDQVDALRRSHDALVAQQDLLSLESQLLDRQFQEMGATYYARLRWPVLTSLAVIIIYLVISRALLPLRFKKEELFLARRLGRYLTILVVVILLAFSFIEDLSLLATTLGLVSAAIVISLQDVCSSFFAWFVIMIGRKFTIGDRLEIDGVRGDVLDIQLLRTTLLEVNNWLGVDQPTGRVLIIPNNFVFKTKVFNFSHGHPYIWGKVEVTVTYDTPAAGAMALFRRILEVETKDDFAEAQIAATTMERRYGVEDAEYHPKIYTRIGDNGITFSLFYVSHYRKSSVVRNRINHRLIAELETHQHIKLAYNTLQVISGAMPIEGGPSAVLGLDATQAPFMGKKI